VPELGKIMRTLVCEGFRVFIVDRVDIRSLALRAFPCREVLRAICEDPGGKKESPITRATKN